MLLLKRTAVCAVVISAAVTLFSVPLVMKYHVYKPKDIKAASGDTILANDKISAVWCEAVEIYHGDGQFVAYTYGSQPHVNLSYVDSSFMTRRVILPNRAYEYWGFHLLKGSTVSMNGCAVLAGAAVTLVKGHGSLLRCMAEATDSIVPRENSSEEESSESESDALTSSISSSQGVFSNETYQSHACDGALEYAKFSMNFSCAKNPGTVSEFLFSHQVAKTDVYYVLFASNPYLETVNTDISVQIELERTRHEHSLASYSCSNGTSCSMPLSFASSQRVYAELPTRNGSWSEAVVRVSCSPRKALFFAFYLVFAIAIFICAFL